jgi:polar amino acid transport system substrate-binding protein
MRKGETKMQAWINDWIAKNNANGNLSGIYKRFHG